MPPFASTRVLAGHPRTRDVALLSRAAQSAGDVLVALRRGEGPGGLLAYGDVLRMRRVLHRRAVFEAFLRMRDSRGADALGPMTLRVLEGCGLLREGSGGASLTRAGRAVSDAMLAAWVGHALVVEGGSSPPMSAPDPGDGLDEAVAALRRSSTALGRGLAPPSSIAALGRGMPTPSEWDVLDAASEGAVAVADLPDRVQADAAGAIDAAGRLRRQGLLEPTRFAKLALTHEGRFVWGLTAAPFLLAWAAGRPGMAAARAQTQPR